MAKAHSGDSLPLGSGARGRDIRNEQPVREPRPSVPNMLPMSAASGYSEAFAPSAPRAPGRSTPVRTDRAGFRSVLRNSQFLRLWMAQVISQTIMNATNYGLLTLIARESRSLFSTALAIVAFAAPALIFGAPAGVLVDHLDRRTVLWASNFLRAVVTLAFVISLHVNSSALAPVYVLTFLIAVVGQFFGPAEGAAIPRLVRPREIINALALFNITFTMAQAAGLVILGPLVLLLAPQFSIGLLGHSLTIMPIDSLLLLVAALYLVCVLLILSIQQKSLEPPNPEESAARLRKPSEAGQLGAVLADIWDALTFIARNLQLSVVVFQLAIAGVVTAVIAMIAPQFVTVYFHQRPEAAALVFVPAGVGLVLGAVFTPNITRRLGHGKTVFLGIIGLPLFTAAIPTAQVVYEYLRRHGFNLQTPYYAALLLLTFLMGIALDFINVPSQAKMQELSPDYIKGRVLAVQIMLFNAITIPVVLTLGHFGDLLGLNFAIGSFAVALLVAGVLSMMLWGVGVQIAARHAAQQGTARIEPRTRPRSGSMR